MRGTVTRAYGKFFDVELDDGSGTLLSTVKGSVRRERRQTDLVAVGDRVWAVDVGEGEGQIEAVEPRRSALSRLARRTRDVEQVILANPDQALFLFAVRNPEPHLRMLDRFLVLAESRDLPAMIAVNKVDRDEGAEGEALARARELFAAYAGVYPLHFISAKTGFGIEELWAALEGKITVIAGPSGVGKSRLLNRLLPELGRKVGSVSEATGKGKHTTTATELLRIGPGTFVADTPGIRALALHGVEPEDLEQCFPELRAYLGNCFYPDCTHVHEPGCAVQEAVERGDISRERYESYAALRRGDTAEE
jgi:ribosome biogenesis GTPase